MRKTRGFTLIELLVVIAIIGILATLVITQLAVARTKAHNATVQNDVSEAGKAIETYRNDDAHPDQVIGTGTTAGASIFLLAAGATGSSTIPTYFTGTEGSAAYPLKLVNTATTDYTYRYTASGAALGSGSVSTNGVASITPSTRNHYTFCGNLINGATAWTAVADGISASGGTAGTGTNSCPAS